MYVFTKISQTQSIYQNVDRFFILKVTYIFRIIKVLKLIYWGGLFGYQSEVRHLCGYTVIKSRTLFKRNLVTITT